MNNQARSIEASGSDVQAAIRAGLAKLGLTRDQVEVQILQEPSRGVLGIGARDAIVRLTEIRPRPQEEPRPKPSGEPVRAQEAPPAEPDVPPVKKETEHPTAQETAPRDEAEELTEGEILEIARDVLQDLLTRMEVEATIQSRIVTPKNSEDGSTLVLDLRGNDLGFLIGRKGETLSALQHILRLIVNKEVRQRVNLLVDIGGYKSRRENALRKLALRVADQVTRRHRRIALEPMNAYERRIIHMALRNHPTVTTESVGERDRRKVTILPKS
jgi:spoIIIJ-associated protein